MKYEFKNVQLLISDVETFVYENEALPADGEVLLGLQGTCKMYLDAWTAAPHANGKIPNEIADLISLSGRVEAALTNCSGFRSTLRFQSAKEKFETTCVEESIRLLEGRLSLGGMSYGARERLQTAIGAQKERLKTLTREQIDRKETASRRYLTESEKTQRLAVLRGELAAAKNNEERERIAKEMAAVKITRGRVA